MRCKLSDICEYVRSKINISSLNVENYISTENMIPNKGGITKSSSLPNLTQTQFFKAGDVLVSNIRPYFKKIYFAKFDGGCSNDVLVFRAKAGIDKKFLYYLLADDKFFNYSTSVSTGTKMPRGDKVAIMNYEVLNIPLSEQEKISSILSLLDDKIELNNRINENLEQQARAIFRAWFVDSDEIFKVGTFSELIESTISGDWGKDSPTDKNIEMVYCIRGADIPDVKAGNKGKMPTRYIIPKNYLAKRLQPGDIVIEISGGSPTQSTGRAVTISQSLINRYDKGIICTNFCRAIKPKAGYSMFIYYYLQYLYDRNIFFLYENGTTGIKNLDLSGFIMNEEIIIPPMNLIKKFDDYCQTIFNMIFANGLQNERLAQIRDSLLPKLISGELDISGLDLSHFARRRPLL